MKILPPVLRGVLNLRTRPALVGLLLALPVVGVFFWSAGSMLPAGPAGLPQARAGETLRTEAGRSLVIYTPGRQALMTLAPETVAVVGKEGKDIELRAGSVRLDPLGAKGAGLSLHAVVPGKHESVHITLAAAAASLQITHDNAVQATVWNGTADVQVQTRSAATATAATPGGEPPETRRLASGQTLRIPGTGESIAAMR